MEQIDKDDKYKWLILILVVIFLLWAASYFVLKHFISDWDNRGTFGDAFGAINALFSGFAFAGIIYTIILQKNELKLQRLEFRRQSFDNDFFEYLRLHREGVNRLHQNRTANLAEWHSGIEHRLKKLSEKNPSNDTIKILYAGIKERHFNEKDFFDNFYAILNYNYKTERVDKNTQTAKESISPFLNGSYYLISGYVKTFFALIDLVKSAFPDEEQKEKRELYYHFIRLSCTTDELRLMVYMTIWKKATQEGVLWHSLLEEIDILEHTGNGKGDYQLIFPSDEIEYRHVND